MIEMSTTVESEAPAIEVPPAPEEPKKTEKPVKEKKPKVPKEKKPKQPKTASHPPYFQVLDFLFESILGFQFFVKL